MPHHELSTNDTAIGIWLLGLLHILLQILLLLLSGNGLLGGAVVIVIGTFFLELHIGLLGIRGRTRERLPTVVVVASVIVLQRN